MKLSQIPGDEAPIRASYGPSRVDLEHRFNCRGRHIYRTNLRDTDSHGVYIYCQFADTGQWAWINNENIRGYKLKGIGLAEVRRAQAA